MKKSGSLNLTDLVLRIGLNGIICMLIVSALPTYAQSGKTAKKVEKSPAAVALSKCWVQTDSLIIKELTKEDLANWVDHPPFRLHCDDNKNYHLKFYEFTVLTLNPFENKTYGVGDSTMIPILARKAIDRLKNGDTVILKGVEITGDENSELEKLPTLSFKIVEKEPQK